MLQVAADDARVVRSVPVAARRSRDELQPEPHGLRRRLAGQPAEERDRLAAVAQQSLVDRPPPRAAGRRRVERIEHAAARLPAHERQRRPAERQVSRRAARRAVVHPRHQRETRRRIVARGATWPRPCRAAYVEAPGRHLLPEPGQASAGRRRERLARKRSRTPSRWVRARLLEQLAALGGDRRRCSRGRRPRSARAAAAPRAPCGRRGGSGRCG